MGIIVFESVAFFVFRNTIFGAAMCNVPRSGDISILDLVNILHFGKNEVIDLAKYIDTTFAKIDESGDGIISSLEFTETVVRISILYLFCRILNLAR
jgi:hypothetical protein